MTIRLFKLSRPSYGGFRHPRKHDGDGSACIMSILRNFTKKVI